MTTALICIALLGSLLLSLGFAVSIRLHKMVRAHGNTAEYAPFLAVRMLVLGSGSPATWVLWCMGIAGIALRVAVV